MPDSFRLFAVLPAAGRSQRMGRPKLLLPWRDRTVIEEVISNWRASRVECVVVVVHPRDERLAELARSAGVEVVQPSEPPPDMKASIRAGLAHLAEAWRPTASDAWLVAPADMPLLDTQSIDLVASAHRPEQPAIITPVHAGRRGHPVLFPWPLHAEVDRLAADQGVDRLLAEHKVRQIECPQSTILVDLDTPDDYRRQHGRDA